MKSVFVHLYKGVIIMPLIFLAINLSSQSCSYVWFEYTYEGCTVNFTGHSLGTASNWYYEFGDGGTSTQQNTAHTYNEGGCYTVLIGINNNEAVYEEEVCFSCQDGSTGNSGNSPGSFNVAVDGPVSVYGGGLPYDYHAVVSGGTGPYTYSWSKLSGPTCTDLFPVNEAATSLDIGDCSGGQVVLELCVTDYLGNEECVSQAITIISAVGDCNMAVSGDLTPGGKVKMRIKDNILGSDCYDAYPYWTWSYGDGTTEGPMFWVTEHVYQEAGDYTITAIGCDNPYSPSACETVQVNIIIGNSGSNTSSPNFGINPPENITINLGESTGDLSPPQPLSIKIINMPQDVNMGTDILTFEYYVVSWILTNNYNGQTTSYTYTLEPGDLADHEFTFTPDASMWGCLDVELQLVPWGYYHGKIDVDCSDFLEPGVDNLCSPNGSYCFGDIGTQGAGPGEVDLSIQYDAATWDSDFGGCVPEGEFGYKFPFIVIEDCKIEVIPQAPEIQDIVVQGSNCDPYLSAEVIKGAMESNTVPAGAPCEGELQDYPEYRWQAFSIFDPNEELDLFIGNDGLRKCIAIDRSHTYFDQFEAGQQPVFICRLTVEDHFGWIDTYSKPIALTTPLIVQMPDEIRRCPFSLTAFDELVVAGGSGTYNFIFGGTGYNYITGEHPNFMIDLQSYSGGSLLISLIVEDELDSNCFIDLGQFSLSVSPITITGVPDEGYACYSGPGANTLGAEVSGGSGGYNYYWSPGTYLDDPYSLNPLIDMAVPGPPEGITETYVLQVTDEFGCTAESDPIKINSMIEAPPADAGEDKTVCYGGSTSLGVDIPGGGVPSHFVWTSDNPLFPGSTSPSPYLPGEVNSLPGAYTYTLQAIADQSGCIDEDEVTVTVAGDQWLYTGYESNLYYIVEGEEGDLWDEPWSGENKFLSGYTGNLFLDTWMPSNPNSTLNNSNGIPGLGKFTPTLETPYLTMRVRDDAGCFRELRSNRYLVTETTPYLSLIAEPNSTVCTGEEICFEIEFIANFQGSASSWFPQNLEAQCTFNDYPGSNGTTTLNLINSQGVYQGSYCMTPSTSNPYGSLMTASIVSEGIFHDISEVHAFYVSAGDEVEAYDIVCGTIGFGDGEKAIKLDIGIDENNCTNTFILGTGSPIFRGGTSVVIHPDQDFYTDSGAEMYVLIDPCLTEELIDDDENSLLAENGKDEKAGQRRENEPGEDPPVSQITDLKVYPNPFTGKVALEYTLSSEGPEYLSLNLLDVTGKKILAVFENRQHTKGTYTETFDGKSLPPGLYFYELITESRSLVKKAVKANY